MSEQFKKTEKGLACCERRGYCEGHCLYYEPEKGALECTSELAHDAHTMIRQQAEKIHELQTKVHELQRIEENLLADFLLDIEASNSILNSVRCHNMSIDTVSKIIMLCGPACDALSPDGFIKWLKDRITDDPRIREEMENDRM